MMVYKTGDLAKNVGDLVAYAQTNRWLADGSGLKSFSQLMDDFKQMTVLDYYKQHIEEFNEDFRIQMIELKEGNLFFDIMMKEVWNKAQSDSVGQMNYYKQHLKKYGWQNSADAVIFYCGDEETANTIKKDISKEPTGWKSIYENSGDRFTIDSGRFEFARIPGLKNTEVKPGLITAIEKNNDDNSASFSYILKVYTIPEQKSFSDAKGDVINDFQTEIDNQWVNTLKKKYPVVINQQVLQSVLK
jgi:peptidyl-prolyl cis-trans isomerase SurA